MILECPHCHTTVIPKSDDRCPACGEDLQNPSETPVTDTSLVVHPGMRLPRRCIVCGAESTRYETISRKRVSREDDSGDSLLILNVILGLLAFLVRTLAFRRRQTITIDVPTCAACAGLAESRLRYTNFENATMTFIVHRSLKEGLGEMKASP